LNQSSLEISNGASRKINFGGMQDWNYFGKECFELTLYLSYASPTTLSDIWNLNQHSLISFMEQTYLMDGRKGIISDARTYEPIAANLSITFTSNFTTVSHFITSNSSSGVYFKFLIAGEYQIEIEANDYIPITQTILVESGQGMKVLNFQMWKKVTNSEEGDTVLYIVLGVVLICSLLIFAVEVIYYGRSKKKRILFFLSFETENNENNQHLEMEQSLIHVNINSDVH